MENHIAPLHRQEMAAEGARLCGLIKKAALLAWQRIEQDPGDGNSLRLFMWSVDSLAAIADVKSPLRIAVENQYRVAGQPPAKLEATMLNRLARRIEDLRSSTAPTVDENPPGR